jgi:hypothetical protein
MSDKLSFYWWRIRILLCYLKHDFKNSYTRVSTDGHYSGKNECKRCYKHEYFSGSFKP